MVDTFCQVPDNRRVKDYRDGFKEWLTKPRPTFDPRDAGFTLEECGCGTFCQDIGGGRCRYDNDRLNQQFGESK